MDVRRGGPRPSLWRLVEEQVPHSELPEVRAVLGQALVDMYTEAHSEVDAWLGIWREVKQGGNRGNGAEAPQRPLADPPAVKELLRGEVRMLLQAVRERAREEGRDGEEVWSRYDPDTVNYALGRSTDDSGCIPGSSHHPQQGSRPVSLSLDLVPSGGDELEAVRDQLNVVHIDRVVDHLRCVLTEDCEALKRQVLWLQEGIEQEYRSQCQVKDTEPTVTELREQRRVIQMDLDLPSPLLPHRPSSFSSSSSVSSSPPTTPRFKNTSRSSAGLKTPHPRTGTPDLRPRPPDLRPRPPDLRPHPLPSLSHVNPSPPPGAPPTRPCSASSVRPLQGSSLTRTGDVQPDGLLPRASEAALGPAASSTQRGTRKQIAPSVYQRNNAKGVENNGVSLNENPKTHGDQRERNTDPSGLSMTDRDAQKGTRRDMTNGCLYNTMSHRLVSATNVSHTQNDSDDNRRGIIGSVTCPMRVNSAALLTAPFRPLPPAVPRLSTGERHLVRRLSVRQDNLLRGQNDALPYTVNT